MELISYRTTRLSSQAGMGEQRSSEGPTTVHPLGGYITSERQRRSWTRKRLAAELRRVGDGATTGVQTIKGWELYGIRPTADAMHWLARVFDVPVGRLVSLADGKLEPQEDEEARRRTFARAAALTLAGTVLPGGLDLERLLALSAGRRVDAPTLDDLEAVTAAYGRQWKVLPSATLLPAVHAHLQTLSRLSVPGSRLRAMMADVAVLAGSLASQADREDRTRAVAYWNLARQLARDVGGETEARALVAASVPHFAIADSTEP